jgi:outer membrane protein assembly factor BamB
MKLGVFLLLGCLAPWSRADWPDFRGPGCDGRAGAAAGTNRIGLPLRWSERENVKWKTPIPHRGWSTPVIVGGQIWLTTATLDGHDFFAVCAEAGAGTIIFDERVFHCDDPEPLGNDVNCYASPSPVVEPGRAYVNFGSYGTACLDTATFKVLWRRDDLPCRHLCGPGSSPVLCGDMLILTMDGIEAQYVAGLDKKTGRTVWKTDRSAEWSKLGPGGGLLSGDLRKAYSTPLIIDVGGAKQMLSIGARAAYSYDPFTGRELWKVRHEGYAPAPRPLFDNGVAFLPTGFGRSELLATRVNGHGDVTDTAIVWRAGKAQPQKPSAVLDGGLIFMVNDGGIASCLDEATGGEVWRERIGGEYSASALCGDGRIYCFSQEGRTTVLKAGRVCEPLATNQLANGFMASAAVCGHALILRTKTDLYRIEESGTQ